MKKESRLMILGRSVESMKENESGESSSLDEIATNFFRKWKRGG